MSEISLKILLIGDSSVGKTSLLLRYTDNNFTDSQISTIGVEYKNKEIKYKDMDIKLQIWDTSGQERFRSLTQNFYRNADGILFVFDLTKPATFEDIRIWLNESEGYAQNFKKLLVGNKNDLAPEVTQERIDKFREKKGIPYVDASAKEGNNVNKVFEDLVEQILGGKSIEEINKNFANERSRINTKLNEPTNNEIKKRRCC